MKAKEPLAYVNGEFVPESKATMSVFDRSIRSGDHVYEVERTFHGKLFKIDEHLTRLYQGLKYCRIDPGFSPGEISRVSKELIERNRPFLGRMRNGRFARW